MDRGSTSNSHSASTEELNAALGYETTDEGKARARSRLAEARTKWTRQRWDALREQLGLPPKNHAA